MKIIIDTRENKLIDLIRSKKITFSFEVNPLDIGDIHCIHNDKIIIIERKTLTDLSASIIDGRYKEQKMRLIASGNKIVYVIEGKGEMEARCKTAIISSQLRDNVSVVRTNSLEDTLNFIETIVRKCDEYFDNETKFEIIETIKACKKENLTPDVCFRAQLMEIPGISHTLSAPLTEVFKNMRDMIVTLNNIPTNEERKLFLSEIRLESRKIGDVVSEKILHYLGFE